MSATLAILAAIWAGVKTVFAPLSGPLTQAVSLKVWAVALIAFGSFFAGCRCAAKPAETCRETVADEWCVLDPQRDEVPVVLSPTRDEPPKCPVAGEHCTCGCRTGGPCTCTAKKPPTDEQAALYYAMLADLKPGQEFFVFVNQDPGAYVPYVRWDKYPGITVGKWTIRGVINADGKPYEKWRRRDDAQPIPAAPPVRPLAFAPPIFSGGGRSC